MDDKEIARLTDEAAAKREMEEQLMTKMNQPKNVNNSPETMREIDENLREKEMARLTDEAAAKREMEEQLMAKMNDFSYPTEGEGLSPKIK